MIDYIVKNFKEKHNTKQIMNQLSKTESILFNLICELLEKTIEELDGYFDDMIYERLQEMNNKSQ